jgi:hypothetical protein
MEFLRVTLQAPSIALTRLRDFYGGRIGLAACDSDCFALGASQLVFQAATGEPFYHFALLVPGDRFEAALAWAGERIDLLPGGDIDGVVFEFEDWDARACYFHDPVGNIVELIAHHGIGEDRAIGRFSASELLGFSELGLVGDVRLIASRVGELGLEIWDGTADEPGRLAFVGERARTLILSPKARGWLPTGRPAEPHPADVLLTGPTTCEVRTGGHRIRREPAADT